MSSFKTTLVPHNLSAFSPQPTHTGTDSSNCQPPPHAFDVMGAGTAQGATVPRRRWLIPDLIGVPAP